MKYIKSSTGPLESDAGSVQRFRLECVLLLIVSLKPFHQDSRLFHKPLNIFFGTKF